ncbi:MAG: LuxR family transcriptional regulator [Sphingopyxis macrogoltabida]|uniref:LuxR family transcriptional regulator n=1 Tax=Sphingopyxis macrogoltabida TaxID=33050 RepID=A0A2W5KWD3_SPHMC|nr:MAG: LuxR family transcriptional regulator [Sphingopyxis macrogoltabida]
MTDVQALCWERMPGLIAEVQAIGDRIGLPYIAAQADLGDPEPMADRDGRPYAETSFRWVDPDHAYWRDRKLALHLAFLTATRLTAEPFYYSEGALHGWRTTRLLESVDCGQARASPHFGEAIIAPVHLPRGLVGTVFWCSREPVGVRRLFDDHAGALHNLALRLVATHNEARGHPRRTDAPLALTRREVQCLRWAAAGKTDGEIGIILSLSISTVRFHLRNAAAKLGATGRAQSIQVAAGLGYVGARAS